MAIMVTTQRTGSRGRARAGGTTRVVRSTVRSSPRQRRSIVLAPFIGTLLVLAAIVGSPATSVFAHAEVIEVVPASNSVLPEAPTEITVTFSEPVSLNG